MSEQEQRTPNRNLDRPIVNDWEQAKARAARELAEKKQRAAEEREAAKLSAALKKPVIEHVVETVPSASQTGEFFVAASGSLVARIWKGTMDLFKTFGHLASYGRKSLDELGEDQLRKAGPAGKLLNMLFGKPKETLGEMAEKEEKEETKKAAEERKKKSRIKEFKEAGFGEKQAKFITGATATTDEGVAEEPKPPKSEEKKS